jgi:hypothetical protein
MLASNQQGLRRGARNVTAKGMGRSTTTNDAVEGSTCVLAVMVEGACRGLYPTWHTSGVLAILVRALTLQ